MPPREAVAFWRAELARCYDGARAADAAGPPPAAVHRASSICRARRSRTSSTAWRWISTRRATRRSTICSSTAAASRRRSADLHPDLRLPERPGAATTRCNLGVALQLTNILRDVKDDLARGRVYLPLEDLRGCGCTVEDLAAGRGDRAGAAAARVRVPARPRLLPRARSTRARRRIAGGWSPPRSCARSTSRRCGASSATATTCSRRARACRSRQALIALRQWLLAVMTTLRRRSSSAPGSPGLSAAVRLTRDGARVLVLEARSRLGGRATAFRRSRDRRARRQRPARAARAATARRSRSCATSARATTCAFSRSWRSR